MWHCTCVPSTIYNVLYKFKPIFRCAQARHFQVFCWLLIALILDSGKGTLKGLCQYLPPKLKYWTLMRMVRSGQWDADILVTRMADDVLRHLPPPVDGGLHLSADSTRKDKRGSKHPLGFVRRESDHAPYTFGFDMVLMIASWDRFRFPIAIAPIDPDIKGHQNKLFRHMLATLSTPKDGYTSLPRYGHVNSQMASMFAISFVICPGTVTAGVQRTPRMDDGVISGSFSVVPRLTNSVMSQSFCPKNGVTRGRNRSDSL